MTQAKKERYRVAVMPRFSGGLHIVQLTPTRDVQEGVIVDLDQVSGLVDQLIEQYEFVTGRRAFAKDVS